MTFEDRIKEIAKLSKSGKYSASDLMAMRMEALHDDAIHEAVMAERDRCASICRRIANEQGDAGYEYENGYYQQGATDCELEIKASK